jgi:formate dehydrogenase accessory protein FdhE
VTTPVQNRSVVSSFEARAARADLLARDSSSATEPLCFAAGLLRAQGRVAAALESQHAVLPFTGRMEAGTGRSAEVHIDLERVRKHSLDILHFAAHHAPAPLALEARVRASEPPETAQMRLALFWTSERTAADDYLSRALLRPYVETLRVLGVTPEREHAHGRCPHCGGAPSIGCRRGGSESEGALRFLVCGLCGLEWSFPRLLCPSCFENDPHKLPSFTSTAHPIARIEGCETCKRYSKSLDLSLDTRPVPEVDDLLSLSLDLWAIEQGFTRIEPGLAGV